MLKNQLLDLGSYPWKSWAPILLLHRESGWLTFFATGTVMYFFWVASYTPASLFLYNFQVVLQCYSIY